jgi:hypothetical protein
MTTLGNRKTSRKALALQCARRGWSVAPLHTISDGNCSCHKGSTCARAGKHPRTQNGFRDATTDRPQIKEWFSESPEANIGIATGSVSGTFVLDIDGNVGRKTLSELESRYGKLPVTVTVKTGLGQHFYFRLNGSQIRNSAGRVGKGIDVRGDGGYVVGVGSVHRSGAKYRYVKGCNPDDVAVADAPAWLLARIAGKPAAKAEKALPKVPAAKLDRAHAYAEAARQQEVERVGKAPNHQRNDTLNIAAFKLGQLLPYEILDETDVVNDLARAAAEIGLDENEIQKTIASGLNAGRQHPRRLPFVKAHSTLPAVGPDQASRESAHQATGEAGRD